MAERGLSIAAALLLSMCVPVVGAGAHDAPRPRWPEAVADWQPPAEPAHRTWFLDRPMPAGGTTVHQDVVNSFLKRYVAHVDDPLGLGLSRQVWKYFGMYAIWGLTSPDSAVRDEPALERLLCFWLDDQFPKPPEDAEKAKDWRPSIADKWGTWYHYAPWVEILARPRLRKIVGPERQKRWVGMLLDSARRTAGEFEKRVDKCVEVVNQPAHQIPHFILGWMLARQRDPALAKDLLRRARYILLMMSWHMQPNGSIFYWYDPDFDGPQLVGEHMYYHAICLRAIYAFWWFTGDETAMELLRRQTPYYKLRMTPWGVDDGSCIWFKVQWRTFWPAEIALAAGAVGDGELARIAVEYADRKLGVDPKFRDWGLHGYTRMALEGVKPLAWRDRFIVENPDIGGLVGRFGPLHFSFASVSFAFTLASAMTPEGGLSRATPLVRIDPPAFREKWAYHNYDVGGRRKPHALVDVRDTCAAAAATFHPWAKADTWKEGASGGPWTFQQAWLYLPDRMVGLMLSFPTERTEARSVEHLFGVMGEQLREASEGGGYAGGDLRVRVADTNLGHRLVEPERKYFLHPREPWRRLVLCDVERPTLPEAREQAGEDEPKPPLEMRTYRPGGVFHSLAEIAREETGPAECELVAARPGLLAFRVRSGRWTCAVAVNFAADAKTLRLPGRDQPLPLPPDSIRLLDAKGK